MLIEKLDFNFYLLFWLFFFRFPFHSYLSLTKIYFAHPLLDQKTYKKERKTTTKTIFNSRIRWWRWCTSSRFRRRSTMMVLAVAVDIINYRRTKDANTCTTTDRMCLVVAEPFNNIMTPSWPKSPWTTTRSLHDSRTIKCMLSRQGRLPMWHARPKPLNHQQNRLSVVEISNSYNLMLRRRRPPQT